MTKDHRGTTIFAGFFLLVQGAAFAVAAIYCCGIYTCFFEYPFTTQLDESEISTLLYVAYFKGQCADTTEGEDTVSPAAKRTFYFMIVSAVFNSILIPTSALLLVSSICCHTKRWESRLYYPWVVSAILVLLLDLIAGVIYGFDVTKTDTVDSFESFIYPAATSLSTDDGLTDIPSIIMLTVFFRGFVIWLLNVILVGVVVRRLMLIRKRKPVRSIPTLKAKPAVQERSSSGSKSDATVWPRVTVPLKGEPPVRATSVFTIQPPAGPAPAQPSIEKKQPPVPPQRPAAPKTQSPRTPSSPVYDVHGRPTGETFPFSNDPNLRFIARRESQRGSFRDRLRSENDFGGVDKDRPWKYADVPQLKLRLKSVRYDDGAELNPPVIPEPDYSRDSPPPTRSQYNDQKWSQRRAQ